MRRIFSGIFIFLLWATTTGAVAAAFVSAVWDYHTVRLWNLLTVAAVFLHAVWLLRWRGLLFLALGMIFGGAYGLAAIRGVNIFAPGFIYLVKSREGWEAYKLFGVLPAQIPVFWCAYAYLSFLVSEFIRWRWLGRRNWMRDLAAAGIAGASMVILLIVTDPVCTAWKVWTWYPAGGYFSMPLSNIPGWFLACGILVLLYRLLLHRPNETRLASVDAPLGLVLYAAFLAFLPALSRLSAAFYFITPVAVLGPVVIALYACLKKKRERLEA